MNISEIFGSNVFNETVMKERLPKKVFAEVMDVMAHGGQHQHGIRRCGGQRHEGLGCGEGCHPLHPLVPAADRHHRGEA